jgi:hypothetical protein
VRDLNLEEDLNLQENSQMYIVYVETKGITRSNVDPKVLREGRDVMIPLL